MRLSNLVTLGRYRNPETGKVVRVFSCVDENGRKRICRIQNGKSTVIPFYEFTKWRKHR